MWARYAGLGQQRLEDLSPMASATALVDSSPGRSDWPGKGPVSAGTRWIMEPPGRSQYPRYAQDRRRSHHCPFWLSM